MEEQLQKARQMVEAGNESAARECLLELLKADSNNQPALIMLGGSYYANAMYSEAEMVFERLILLSPAVGKASIALFNTLWKMDRKEEALEEIRRFMQNADHEQEKETIEQYQAITAAIQNDEM